MVRYFPCPNSVKINQAEYFLNFIIDSDSYARKIGIAANEKVS
ncbi:hypothetical protein yrohd0001_36490 [Yersinia rohdei ATCC 43380]|nr:hypothetical protein yrohd0001_36490 [Yersinia rohdei ATCC 43380]